MREVVGSGMVATGLPPVVVMVEDGPVVTGPDSTEVLVVGIGTRVVGLDASDGDVATDGEVAGEVVGVGVMKISVVVGVPSYVVATITGMDEDAVSFGEFSAVVVKPKLVKTAGANEYWIVDV